jgi:hypothetical protein
VGCPFITVAASLRCHRHISRTCEGAFIVGRDVPGREGRDHPSSRRSVANAKVAVDFGDRALVPSRSGRTTSTIDGAFDDERPSLRSARVRIRVTTLADLLTE